MMQREFGFATEHLPRVGDRVVCTRPKMVETMPSSYFDIDPEPVITWETEMEEGTVVRVIMIRHDDGSLSYPSEWREIRKKGNSP